MVFIVSELTMYGLHKLTPKTQIRITSNKCKYSLRCFPVVGSTSLVCQNA